MQTFPKGIIKMTNVAFIKYKVGNKKFEIACYKNKAINWRNGVEKDLSEVLQTEEVYTNASHGTIASKGDLEQCFGNMKKKEIIKTILEKGELQVGDKEREVQLSSLQNDILNIITEKCVHPDSQRKFSIVQIQQAVKSVGFKVKPDQPAKKQALECIRLLLKKFYMQRAEMLISVNLPQKDQKQLMIHLQELEIEESSIQKTVKKDNGRIELVMSLEPSKFRPLSQKVKEELSDCILEVISNVVTNDAVEDIENAGSANLKVRDDWNEDAEEEERKQQKKEEKAKKVEKENSDDDLEEAKVEEGGNKKKNKKKKNPQLDMRMQQEREREYQQQQAKLEEIAKAKQEWISKEKAKVLESKQPDNGNQTNNTNKPEEAPKGSKKCSSCKEAFFETNEEYRAHFKSDWHIFNVKRKQEAKELLTEIEFRATNLDQNFA